MLPFARSTSFWYSSHITVILIVAFYLVDADLSGDPGVSKKASNRAAAYRQQSLSSDTLGAIKLFFAGDCNLADHFEEFVGDSFDYPFRMFSWFALGDISMVNLEGPVTRGGRKVEKEFNFKIPPKYLQTIVNGGIDIVSIANNHIFDFGSEGLIETIQFLDSVGIKHVGAGKGLEEARRPVIFELKGMRIGFLAYFGLGTFGANKNDPRVAPRLERYIAEDIKKLKQEHLTDYVVVNFHWGIEKAIYPSEWQLKLAHRAIDAGADLIVGHHPHVLQGIERYKKGVIAYSLGNFIFGGNNRRTYDTAVLQVVLSREKREFSLIPVRVKDWQPRVLEGPEADKVLSSVKALSRKFRESIF